MYLAVFRNRLAAFVDWLRLSLLDDHTDTEGDGLVSMLFGTGLQSFQVAV